MAVKRYDGSQWVTVAGKGDQGTSSSIATWVKTATGGETSVSGNDDNSQPLSYTVGQELVFINGALQKRGSDYTATTGNSITGLTALAANDVVTVWTVNAFSVTGAIANSLVDAKGDLIVATGADTPGRLAVGTANQVLTVDSSTGTGLKWATPSSGSLTQLATGTLSGSSVTIDNISGSYTDLRLDVVDWYASSDSYLQLKFNNISLEYDGENTFYQGGVAYTATMEISGNTDGSDQGNFSTTLIPLYSVAGIRKFTRTWFHTANPTTATSGNIGGWKVGAKTTNAITRLDLNPSAGTFSGGTYYLYGVK